MFEVDIINGKPKCKPIEYTKYFINYQSPVIKGIFVIDIVSKNYIRDFIKKINLDITNIANRIQQNILSMAKK